MRAKVWGFLGLLLLLNAPEGQAEQRILRSRRGATTAVPGQKRLLPKKIRRLVHPLDHSSFSLLLHTPLIHENTYDGRFTGIGAQFLFSVPVSQMGETGYLHVEFGPGLSFASVSLAQPETKFTHLYFMVPVRLRGLWLMGKSTALELSGGVIYRPFEYDSRPTTDGGFHANSSVSKIELDASIGVQLGLSSSSRLRFSAGYQFLAGGIEFLF